MWKHETNDSFGATRSGGMEGWRRRRHPAPSPLPASTKRRRGNIFDPAELEPWTRTVCDNDEYLNRACDNFAARESGTVEEAGCTVSAVGTCEGHASLQWTEEPDAELVLLVLAVSVVRVDGVVCWCYSRCSCCWCCWCC